jgi:acyl-CoA thioesterase-1
MKRKQRAWSLADEMGRLFVLVNLWLAAMVGAALAGDGARPVRIVALGDSLTAGYGLKASESFPEQLAAMLRTKGRNVEVSNAGVSGDTTAGGLARFDWAVPDGTDAVILELGANDALRGVDPGKTRANLDRILTRLRERNIEVLLAGMLAPRNWGKPYQDEFGSIYTDLAKKHGALLYPFFLDGVALDPKLNLDDGLHPTGKGVGIIVERMLPKIEELVARVRDRQVAPSKS